jgi:hypothetical protein
MSMQPYFVGAIAALFLTGQSLTEQRESPLAAYVNLDLRKLDEKQKIELRNLLAKLLPNDFQRKLLWPHSIWRNKFTKDKDGFILFQVSAIVSIPGESPVAVHFFDDSGKLISSSSFSTGWRSAFTSATLREDDILEGYCIEVQTSPVINGRDMTIMAGRHGQTTTSSNGRIWPLRSGITWISAGKESCRANRKDLKMFTWSRGASQNSWTSSNHSRTFLLAQPGSDSRR